MTRLDPNVLRHYEWLGPLDRVGLVVSPHALVAAQAFVQSDVVALHGRFVDLLRTDEDDEGNEHPVLADLPTFCREILDWDDADLAGDGRPVPLPDSLEIPLTEYGEVLRPTWAVPDPEAAGRWLLLVQSLPQGTAFDRAATADAEGWNASPQVRFERLLRETGVPTGVLWNGDGIRLVHAPPGETSGHLTFPIRFLATVPGRPAFSGLVLLLGAERLFTLPDAQRLPRILAESRRYQNTVTTRLAEQVQEGLRDLLAGFQAADEAAKGALLSEALREEPDHVYGGLLTTLMRLVFLLYTEEQGLLPSEPVFVQHYSVLGLFERLRADASLHPDTMDQRYGAWARLLSLFRLVHDGGGHGPTYLPARHGRLFDPDAFPFLEGRPWRSVRQAGARIDPPRVGDGTVLRVLESLLVLDGDRLTYRALDVEQIGSVYEAMMGFSLEVATGPSVAVGKDRILVDLEALLIEAPRNRGKWLKEHAGLDLKGTALAALQVAAVPDAAALALGKHVSERTRGTLPKGTLYLQPTEERRRSGSHYTPRALTEPIVAATLRPVFDALGPHPRPEAILALKVCDPAMGSGAFLVAACRWLAEHLQTAWLHHKALPAIPPDEDPLLHARRLVAQNCLYGVDKNPFAVDLARLSVWLVTLARDHAFTFVDHALRHGDSLVGYGRQQIAAFHPDGARAGQPQVRLFERAVTRAVEDALTRRRALLALGDAGEERKWGLLAEADEALGVVRLVGDCLVAAFFDGSNDRERAQRRQEYLQRLEVWLDGGDAAMRQAIEDDVVTPLRKGSAGRPPVPAFHWEVEFPEVFERESPGFDAFVGNPPFGGKNTTTASNRGGYLSWLQALHAESHGNADLVAHFFRRAFDLLRPNGTFGLIATNTIAQGDTRGTGLRWICTHCGTIYRALRRYKWPAGAAVVVSVVHVCKGPWTGPRLLDGVERKEITAFLFHEGGHLDPAPLQANAGRSFIGSYVLGMGFTFDDTNPEATPIAEMRRLVAKDPRNSKCIFPYIGGEEVNESPTHAYRRYIINFGESTEEEAWTWPDLMAIVDQKVRPQREHDNRAAYRRYWWQYAEKRAELCTAVRGAKKVLVCCQTSRTQAFTYLPGEMVYSHKLVVFPDDKLGFFSTLQGRAHEFWVRMFGSTMKDDTVYTPSDCFETFPFPSGWETDPALEAVGKAYYEFRADLMVRHDEGLTTTYNRFHDPDERDPGILRLRELHAAMDRTVLDAYGWTDVPTDCEFILDYEDEEEDGDGRPSRRRKPWRLRWPDSVRDDVLARLLDLNRLRAAEEAALGRPPQARDAASAARPRGRPRKTPPPDQGSLF